MHADRTNRILLLLLALLLITAGAAAGAASIGAFGTATRHSLLIANPAGHFIETQGSWLWPAAAAAAVILARCAGCSRCCSPPTAPVTCRSPPAVPRAAPPWPLGP